MKKILAMVMAIVMMMAIAVPAFAADKTITAAGSDTSTVKTSTANVLGEGTFTLTYPAEMSIDWEAPNNSNYNYSYSVTSNFKTGYGVKVTVGGGTNGFVMAKENVGEIPYTLTVTGDDDLVATTTKEVVKADEFVMPLVVSVAADAWKAVSIDEYADTITFTAEIVELATA